MNESTLASHLLPVNSFTEMFLVLFDALTVERGQLQIIFFYSWCKAIKRLASPSFISTQPLFVSSFETKTLHKEQEQA